MKPLLILVGLAALSAASACRAARPEPVAIVAKPEVRYYMIADT